MAQDQIQLVAGQLVDADVLLPGSSSINSIRVDTPPGGPWLFFPESGEFTPPGTMARYVTITQATRRKHVLAVPPAGQFQPSTAGQIAATVTYSDQYARQHGAIIGAAFNNYGRACFAVSSATGSFVADFGFPVNTVTVNNPGGQWIQLPGLATIPPWTVGVSVPLSVASRFVSVNETPPPGQTNSNNGSPATVCGTEQQLPPSNGMALSPLPTNAFTRSFLGIPPNAPDSGNIPLGFLCNSILIDNPGGQWFLAHDGLTFRIVPPWTVGVVIAPAQGLANGRYASNAPPAGQINTGAGNGTTIIWSEQVLAPSPGVLCAPVLNSAQGNAVPAVGGFTGPALAAPTFSFSLPIPAGTWYLRFLDCAVIDTTGVFPAGNVLLQSGTNITGNLPLSLSSGFFGPGADGAVKLVRDYGQAAKITAAGGALLNFIATNQAGGTFAAGSLNAEVSVFLLPVNT